MSDYFKLQTSQDASLYLELARSDGSALTGSDPRVSIRRHRDITGSLLDNYFWDGSGSFTASATFHSMTEIDSTNSPGLYHYHFSQSMVQEQYVYNVYYSSSLGYDVETIMFETLGTELFSGDLNVYESEPDPSR